MLIFNNKTGGVKTPTTKGETMNKKQERQEAIEYIKKHIRKGDTLYTPSYWSYYVSKILGYKLKDNGAIFVKGCGMDIGFHVIYSLSQTLFNDGYAIKQRWI